MEYSMEISNWTALSNFSYYAENNSITDEYGDAAIYHLDPKMKLIKEYIRYYLTPTVVVLGFIGNTISWMTLLKSKLNNFSSSHYLAAVCIVNTAYLAESCLNWLSIHNIVIKNRPGLCQVMSFVENISLFLSNWYVVAFCMDRYISMCWPTEVIRLCTKVRARVVITGLLILATVIYVNMSITEGIVYINGHLRCRPLPFFLHNIRLLVVIKCIMNIILPYSCIILLALLILRRLYALNQRDVFSDDNSPLLLKHTTFTFLVMFFLLHAPYEFYHVIRIMRGLINNKYRTEKWEIFTQAMLLNLFNVSLIIHVFVYLSTYPLFRNYLKQHLVTISRRLATCTCFSNKGGAEVQTSTTFVSCGQNKSKTERSGIEFTGITQCDESAI